MKHQGVLVGQSGGPTSVINASLAGVIREAQKNVRSRAIERVLGMRFAIEGFMSGRTVDLTGLSEDAVDRLSRTPSSALGSCRYKLRDEDLPSILELLDRHRIGYLFYIGGNDTMDTIHRIEVYANKQGYELTGIGIPKTVDNDLFGTHHTPGYPSAARYVALTAKQSGRLARDMQKVDQFVIHQTVGREAGWLAAASALARERDTDPPHLIYLPEAPTSRDRLLEDVETTYRTRGFVSIVVGEGLTWEDGSAVSGTATVDGFANQEFGAMGGGGAAFTLHKIISDHFGFRGEFQIPESAAMCAVDRVVERDRLEAFGAGEEAVRLAVQGHSGLMVSLTGTAPSAEVPSDELYGRAPLSEVAVRAKPMPKGMFHANGVTDEFMRYARPLVGPIEAYADVADDWLPKGEER